MTETKLVGTAQRRVDGRAKVTGQARYAAEHFADDMLHGWVVSSAITKGRIKRIDTAPSLRVPGVVHVLSHLNRPGLPWFDRSYRDDDAPPGSPLRFFYDDRIVHASQPVALVVAVSLEAARCGAMQLEVEYEAEPHQTDFKLAALDPHEIKRTKLGYEKPPKPRGDVDAALAQSHARIEARYDAPIEHHHPLEMHASTVVYEADGALTIHDKTQGVQNSQRYVCKVFGLDSDKVRVHAPFVGGAFGSGLRPQYQLYLAVMASLALERSVRVVLTRRQMFTFGHRPETRQTLKLGADETGKLTALVHEAVAETSRFEDYMEVLVNWSTLLYPCEHTRQTHRLASVDGYTPLDMRSPGASYGVYAIECAMDELAHALKMDPLALRLRNYAEKDHNADKPFSSKELRACYREGAARFGWEARTHEPRSMRRGDTLVGWGMATGVWDAMQAPARARARFTADGRLTVCSATADIGTGTYTVMSQIAADVLGLPLERVRFELGDSNQPFSPFEGGSMTVASVGSAVKEACEAVRSELWELARKHAPAFGGLQPEQVTFADGSMYGASGEALELTSLMQTAKTLVVEQEVTTVPHLKAQSKVARNTHSAVFVEVEVDEALGKVRVTRVVSAIAAGRIMNLKTARSQIQGAVVWGIGMALHEETHVHHALGRYANATLSEYHVPVNADIGEIDVIFVPEEDRVVNPLGAKGVGEIGIVGVAAAVANAVFHATGRRIRSLPLTLDKLLEAP